MVHTGSQPLGGAWKEPTQVPAFSKHAIQWKGRQAERLKSMYDLFNRYTHTHIQVVQAGRGNPSDKRVKEFSYYNGFGAGPSKSTYNT